MKENNEMQKASQLQEYLERFHLKGKLSREAPNTPLSDATASPLESRTRRRYPTPDDFPAGLTVPATSHIRSG